MDNFQRVGSVSNAHVGSDFEEAARQLLGLRGLRLDKDFGLSIGIGEKKKQRRFDLGSAASRTVVECKSHKWTASGNVPSAKMTVWNEAMYYFALAPEGYRKILSVLRGYSHKKRETLAEYYIRTHGHLVPDGVEIWEYDETTGDAVVWKNHLTSTDSSFPNPLRLVLELSPSHSNEELPPYCVASRQRFLPHSGK